MLQGFQILPRRQRQGYLVRGAHLAPCHCHKPPTCKDIPQRLGLLILLGLLDLLDLSGLLFYQASSLQRPMMRQLLSIGLALSFGRTRADFLSYTLTEWFWQSCKFIQGTRFTTSTC